MIYEPYLNNELTQLNIIKIDSGHKFSAFLTSKIALFIDIY